jgi:hypothetical protein
MDAVLATRGAGGRVQWTALHDECSALFLSWEELYHHRETIKALMKKAFEGGDAASMSQSVYRQFSALKKAFLRQAGAAPVAAAAAAAAPAPPTYQSAQWLSDAIINAYSEHFRAAIIAPPSSGKSHLVRLLLSDWIATDTFDKILIVGPNGVEDYGTIPNDDVIEFCDLELSELAEFNDESEEAAEEARASSAEISRRLVVFDDVVGAEGLRECQPAMETMFIRGSHWRLSVLILSQQHNRLLTPTIRSQLDIWMMSNINSAQAAALYPWLPETGLIKPRFAITISEQCTARAFGVVIRAVPRKIYLVRDGEAPAPVNLDAPRPHRMADLSDEAAEAVIGALEDQAREDARELVRKRKRELEEAEAELAMFEHTAEQEEAFAHALDDDEN